MGERERFFHLTQEGTCHRLRRASFSFVPKGSTCFGGRLSASFRRVLPLLHMDFEKNGGPPLDYTPLPPILQWIFVKQRATARLHSVTTDSTVDFHTTTRLARLAVGRGDDSAVRLTDSGATLQGRPPSGLNRLRSGSELPLMV